MSELILPLEREMRLQDRAYIRQCRAKHNDLYTGPYDPDTAPPDEVMDDGARVSLDAIPIPDLTRKRGGLTTRLSPNEVEKLVRALTAERNFLASRVRTLSNELLHIAQKACLAQGADVGETNVSSMKLVALECALKHSVTFAELLGTSRRKPIVNARHEAFYRCVVETGKSYSEVGRFFGNRDHTTILYGARKFAKGNGLVRNLQDSLRDRSPSGGWTAPGFGGSNYGDGVSVNVGGSSPI